MTADNEITAGDQNFQSAPWLEPGAFRSLDGQETLTPDGATALDFWRWAFGDLRANATRGVLAEFLVGRALGAAGSNRIEWDNYDLITPGKVRVEVKAAGYLQSWRQRTHSTIRFSGLTGLAWDESKNRRGSARELRADVYVFALQICRDPLTYDPLDLDQWRFRVASVDQVESLRARSTGLAALERLGLREVVWRDLAAAVNEASHWRTERA